MGQSISGGMAEIKGAGAADDQIVALGLGSCIGVCMYDRKQRIAGMAHVMLPESQGRRKSQEGKFADTAVPALVEAMEKAGASRKDLLAAIAGGAEVFSFGSESPTLAIGKRNAASVKEALKAEGVRLVAEDIGGNVGRTVSIEVGTGRITVRPVGGGLKDLAQLG